MNDDEYDHRYDAFRYAWEANHIHFEIEWTWGVEPKKRAKVTDGKPEVGTFGAPSGGAPGRKMSKTKIMMDQVLRAEGTVVLVHSDGTFETFSEIQDVEVRDGDVG